MITESVVLINDAHQEPYCCEPRGIGSHLRFWQRKNAFLADNPLGCCVWEDESPANRRELARDIFIASFRHRTFKELIKIPRANHYSIWNHWFDHKSAFDTLHIRGDGFSSVNKLARDPGAYVVLAKSQLLGYFDFIVERDPGPMIGFHDVGLARGNAGLLVHDVGLTQVDQNLSNANDDKANSKNDFIPMRPYRGLPMAAGWALLALAGWFWAARHDRNGLALCLLIAAFAGTYAMLIVASGLFPATRPVLTHSLGVGS
jgi:hypothetical protein